MFPAVPQWRGRPCGGQFSFDDLVRYSSGLDEDVLLALGSSRGMTILDTLPRAFSNMFNVEDLRPLVEMKTLA